MEELNELFDRMSIIFINLADLEAKGLYASEEYDLLVDNLLETFECEREVFKRLKNNLSHPVDFNNKLAELRFANTKKFIEQFPQTAFVTDKLDANVFGDLENRKRALKNVASCDHRMMWFKYMRKGIDDCNNEELKKDLITGFYIQTSIWPWASREFAQQKFVFDDDYILKSYFYGDMLGLSKKDVMDVIDSVCLPEFILACNKVVEFARYKSELVNNDVVIDEYLAAIKASVSLMSEECQSEAIYNLYFKTFNYCGKSKEFKTMAEIAYDRDNLKQDYKVMMLSSEVK